MQTVHAKLVTCFLRDSAAGSSFSAWVATKLPAPKDLTASTLARFVELERLWQPGSPTDRCVRAVRTLQTLPAPSECSAPSALVASVEDWLAAVPAVDRSKASFELGVCDRLARALFRGENASIPDHFPAPPTIEDAVRLTPGAPPSNMQQLRAFCRDRVGQGEAFVTALRTLGRLGKALGESPALPPWNLDATTLLPIELGRIGRSEDVSVWLRSLLDEDAACSVLELGSERCRVCRERSDESLYDCGLLQGVRTSWATRTRSSVLSLSLLAGFGGLLVWGVRLRRAFRVDGGWRAQAIGILRGIGLRARPDRLRYLFPSRFACLDVELPAEPAWERWGRRAVLVKSQGASLGERDVNRAGVTARMRGAELAFLLHDDAASPELGAVRAMLEWAARGAGKAVHVLALPWSRLQWSRAATDLLELAEESSLRTNPFEVRGRVTSSTQFFNRERLVSGLLAGVQAGRFVVVTGLRRFGKSSLALEVARRLPGPSAYADLTGFHHELGVSNDPAAAADAILRFLCLRLIESAQARSPGVPLPVKAPEGPMDAATLAVWFRDFGRVLARTERGRVPPMLLILDELEQAIGAAKELSHALDAFAIVVGRLKNCLPDVSSEGQRVGVLFCSALHPLLWSPLAPLAHQSLIASFEYVSVACLAEDVAGQMMRGLGSRQGIRFTDPALELLVRESQGVPLLLRRLGTVVLELYDPERARQGSLGAVEIGVEGVRAALERAESEGSPLRVWVESEIAEPTSPGGAVLRTLAAGGVERPHELRRIAARVFRDQFAATGVARTLSPGEADRRAEEAAGVVVRTLGESGLLRAHGDPTEPEGYELPDGIIRRILRSSASSSGV